MRILRTLLLILFIITSVVFGIDQYRSYKDKDKNAPIISCDNDVMHLSVDSTDEDLLKGVDPEEPILLLQHEPSDLYDLEKYGVDLSVSGHTHDGQIFPGNIITRILSDQSYGMRDWGKSTAIVTSGVGYYGPPIRVCTISEIVVIDLV